MPEKSRGGTLYTIRYYGRCCRGEHRRFNSLVDSSLERGILSPGSCYHRVKAGECFMGVSRNTIQYHTGGYPSDK